MEAKTDVKEGKGKEQKKRFDIDEYEGEGKKDTMKDKRSQDQGYGYLLKMNIMKFSAEKMEQLTKDMNSINDFIVNDNLRLRDNYLNDQLARCNKEISSKIDYDLKIKELTECIESIKQKISRLFDEITELSNKLGEIKKNKPFTPRNKQPIITPEEEVINTRLEKIPHDKNNLEELISSYESTIENYRNFKVAQDDNISYAEKHKQFILDNWERYEHDGTMIILPSRP